MLIGLFAATVVGSVCGDFVVYQMGKRLRRIRRTSATRSTARPLSRLLLKIRNRPVAACVGARMLPGGRLVSAALCGRTHVGVRVFFIASLASSTVWSVYMVTVGAVLGPATKGDPIVTLLCGLALAAVTVLGVRFCGRRSSRRLNRLGEPDQREPPSSRFDDR